MVEKILTACYMNTKVMQHIDHQKFLIHLEILLNEIMYVNKSIKK